MVHLSRLVILLLLVGFAAISWGIFIDDDAGIVRGGRWLIAAGTPLTLYNAWRQHRQWRRDNRSWLGQCVECGYDLRGSPGRCPECGAAAPPPTRPPAPPDHGLEPGRLARSVRSKRTLVLAAVGAAILIPPSIAFVTRPRVVHRISIPGHPTRSVDFLQRRSISGEPVGYTLRLSNGLELELERLMPADMSLEELRRDVSVNYDGSTLVVRFPRGTFESVPGYQP
jgi:hypothetical protein